MMLTINPAAYLVHENGSAPSLPPDKAFGYVLAGNGVFKVARSRLIDARIQIARARVAGLPALGQYVRALFGRVPGEMLYEVLAQARSESWERPTEAMYHIVLRDGVVRVLRPQQESGGASLAYRGGDGTDVVCDLHSHHEMGAFFSSTDDRDELGFRFYAVIGRIFTRPEIALRIGVYGDWARVPIATLFTSPGPFREVER